MGKLACNTIGFLGRLRRDVRGNVIALVAAGIFPLMGLVGGAVDMGRLYAVKSRLQAACDSGALAGRRMMGAGQWADNNGRANDVAQKTFDLNFTAGSFGSGTRTRQFSESDGTVTGTASVDVPMTLMRLFGMPQKTLTVVCDGMMRIPNTDVMFVLDNSGSMDEVIPGDVTGMTKMVGLRTAIKCFYEALAKQNIDGVSPSDCGTTADPNGGLSSQVQLRFGFVNYDNMVNVGKLLPHDFIANSAGYQSRVPNFQDVWSWTLGGEGATEWISWSSAPANLNRASSYSNWVVVSGSGSVTINGTSYSKTVSGKTSSSCAQLNTNNGGVAYTDNGSVQNPSLQNTTNNPPVYPAPSQSLSYSQSDNHTATGFQYAWTTVSNVTTCRLQSAIASYTLTRSGNATKPVIWTQSTTIANWTYRPAVMLDVSGLKGSGTEWNGSVSLPITEAAGATVKLSGSNSDTTLKVLANSIVPWDGCIEERKTFLNTDGDPSNDWTNYPLTPADAWDMDIDRVPDGDPDTQWKPLLTGAVWGRKDTLSGTSWSGSISNDPKTGGLVGTSNSARNLSSFTTCVTPSRRLASYSGRSGEQTPGDFDSYVDTIVPNGNTYHDIGLLWGARLMSPTGIFAADNATTPGGAQITRHMIFMTDGATANTYNNYASYGLEWWDRRQVSPVGLTTSQYQTRLQTNNNARANALCRAIKNRNITLWVISYGNSVDTTTQNRLKTCSTSTSFFFSAANTTQLISKFRTIADKISNLRLTK